MATASTTRTTSRAAAPDFARQLGGRLFGAGLGRVRRIASRQLFVHLTIPHQISSACLDVELDQTRFTGPGESGYRTDHGAQKVATLHWDGMSATPHRALARPSLTLSSKLLSIRRRPQCGPATGEHRMSWAESMKEQANVASQDYSSSDANVTHSTASISWDPHEVWLTRVKQPRERAASRGTSPADSQVPGLPD